MGYPVSKSTNVPSIQKIVPYVSMKHILDVVYVLNINAVVLPTFDAFLSIWGSYRKIPGESGYVRQMDPLIHEEKFSLPLSTESQDMIKKMLAYILYSLKYIHQKI